MILNEIERAVIEKLCAGVSMPEPVHHIMSDGVSIGYYSLDQLRTAIAAARMKALEDAALICGNLHWTWRMGDNSGPKECEVAIRALRGET